MAAHLEFTFDMSESSLYSRTLRRDTVKNLMDAYEWRRQFDGLGRPIPDDDNEEDEPEGR